MGVSPYVYNLSNELTSKPGTAYTYDNNGNLLSKDDAGGTTSYVWDPENRLTSVTLPGSGETVSFQYDPFGRRIYKSSPYGTTIFVYDGINVIEEVSADGSLVALYTHGLNMDEPLAMLRGNTMRYYLADGLGSVTSLTDAKGNLTSTYQYDSFGNLTASTGSIFNPFRYTGREFDTETGLYFYRARYYDPSIGRFISEDPIRFRGGINFYCYVKNNPINWIDPFGLCRKKGETFLDCLNRHAHDEFPLLVYFDNFGWYGLSSAIVGTSVSAFDVFVNSAGKRAIEDAYLAAAKKTGNILEKMTAAKAAEKAAARIALLRTTLGVASKASFVIGVASTVTSVYARSLNYWE